IGLGGLGVLIPGEVAPVAGSGLWSVVLDGSQATVAGLNQPSAVAVDGAGNLYIADSAHHRLRMVTASTGVISTIAGDGIEAYRGDGGVAVSASLGSPTGVALDGAGNLYIADSILNVVRKLTAIPGASPSTWIISTVAGTGTAGSGGDGGPASSATLNMPTGVTLDASGNLYIADTDNHEIRKVTLATGTITTVAGKLVNSANGSGGYSGDGGPATAAELNFPYTVAFDAAENMYIPDSGNNVVRVVNATTNKISSFAGTGVAGDSGDGAAATSALLSSPMSAVVDVAGNVYIADTQNSTIRKVSASTGKIQTAIQSGQQDYLLATSVDSDSVTAPMGLAIDGVGDVFLADYYGMRIWEMKSNATVLNTTGTPTREKTSSATLNETVENDGNAALTITAITPDANAEVDATSTTCTIASLAVNASCVIGGIFSPTTAGDPLVANIDLAYNPTTSASASTLDIQLAGDATAVYSTTTTLKSSLSPSDFGQNVIFTATVTTGATTGNLTGTVSFYDGATLLNTGSLNAPAGTTATATFATSALTVGPHSIYAAYNADSVHTSSKSTDNGASALAQVVYESTATSLASSINPSQPGASLTFTATVTVNDGGGVAPDLSVTFIDGATLLATQPLNSSGVASYTSSTLTAGSHSITAVYIGDAPNYILGSSNLLNQSVLGATTTTVASSSQPSSYGSPIT
ncbi:MAG: Ig-like domain repeat protein, partial [Tepidisphaeraceae bacterium]